MGAALGVVPAMVVPPEIRGVSVPLIGTGTIGERRGPCIPLSFVPLFIL
jgi:hypothetical protein